MEVATRPARRAIKSEPMTIRPLEVRDVESVVAMAEEEWPNLFPRLHFDTDRLRLILTFHLGNPTSGGWVLVNPDDVVFGFLGLFIYVITLTGEVVADEYWWYVDPAVRGRHGFRLLKMGEAWAKASGASSIQAGFRNEKLRPILERMGYHLDALNFSKEL